MSINKKFNIALITGGASGLGFSFARELAKTGSGIILISSNPANLKSAREKLESEYKVKVHTLAQDLTTPESIAMVFSYLDGESLYPDLLINNAGLGYYGGFMKNTTGNDRKTIDLNITAPTLICKEILRRGMITANRGTILNISSTVAFRKSPDWAVYAASKSYIFSLTRSLATEYKGSGINFAVLCPGKIDTNFDMHAGLNYSKEPAKQSPDYIAEYTLKQLSRGKSTIIPGFKNKLKYLIFKYMPDFVTDPVIPKL